MPMTVIFTGKGDNQVVLLVLMHVTTQVQDWMIQSCV